jgi:DnaJ like chaperone protein
MPEPVRFARVAEAYLSSANISSKPRSAPDSQFSDKVEFSLEAQEKSREFLLKVKKESPSEVPPPKHQVENDIDILGLSANATRDQVRKAYLAAIKQYHPDNFAGFCSEFRKLAEEKSKQINLAYQKLTGT